MWMSSCWPSLLLPQEGQHHTHRRPGQLGFLNGPWGFYRMGPGVGQGLSGGLRRRHPLAHLGPRRLQSHLFLGPLGPTSFCLGLSLRRALKCTGQGGCHRRDLPGSLWAPGPGGEPGLGTLAAQGARGWLALGQACSPRQPLMPLSPSQILGHWGQQGGAREKKGDWHMDMHEYQPQGSWLEGAHGGWEQRLE